ncbi:hypothetical protein MPLB_1760009 [Mesorhizobium sp. ORS 3324]|nr:hypothetical protein MPLB_1760009 [Mesorhizobium sp. ORS 3324]
MNKHGRAFQVSCLFCRSALHCNLRARDRLSLFHAAGLDVAAGLYEGSLGISSLGDSYGAQSDKTWNRPGRYKRWPNTG